MNASMMWKGEQLFEINNHGIITHTDATPEHGGQEQHPTPKELVINAMMGCTAMDVVAILKKMRQDIRFFGVKINVEKTTEHPIHFKSALITYDLHGDIAPEKAIKAVESSMTKYCGVNFMISRSCDISYQVFLNGVEIKKDKANFA